MLYKFFHITISNATSEEEAMNVFIKNHRVIETEKVFYSNATGGYWCFCLSYIESYGNLDQNFDKRKPKIDYKEVLDDESFERFVRLREIRKLIASEEGLPPYAVFNNDELAEIAKLSEINKSDLLKINGVGEKKVEKYAEKFKIMYDEMLKTTM